MSTQKYEHKKVKVHQTLTAAYIASYAPQIAKYVCRFIPLYEKAGFAAFDMDKETGYWRYQQYVEKIPKFLYRAKTRAEAEDTIKAFFKEVNERIENAKAQKQLPEDFPVLFGHYQVLQSVQAIEQLPHSDKAKIWEFRYGIKLPSVDYIKPVDERTEEILASEKAIVMGNEIVIRFSGNHLIDVQYSRLPMLRTKRKQMFNLLGEPDTVEEYQKTAKVILKAFPNLAMILPFVQAVNGELLGVVEESVVAKGKQLDTSIILPPIQLENYKSLVIKNLNEAQKETLKKIIERLEEWAKKIKSVKSVLNKLSDGTTSILLYTLPPDVKDIDTMPIPSQYFLGTIGDKWKGYLNANYGGSAPYTAGGATYNIKGKAETIIGSNNFKENNEYYFLSAVIAFLDEMHHATITYIKEETYTVKGIESEQTESLEHYFLFNSLSDAYDKHLFRKEEEGNIEQKIKNHLQSDIKSLKSFYMMYLISQNNAPDAIGKIKIEEAVNYYKNYFQLELDY